MYNDHKIIERLVSRELPVIPVIDSTAIKDSLLVLPLIDSVLFTWQWKDYKKRNQSIQFKLAKVDFDLATGNRVSDADVFFGIEDLWNQMYKFDRGKLKDIVSAYRSGIRANGYQGQDALDFIVSSIQYIGYTFVCVGNDLSRCGIEDAPRQDCRPLNIGGKNQMGCCDNVKPLGVFSPLEFAFKRTGDCDTKALFAYTILKELGYNNVSMIHGLTDNGAHAMLGVKVPSPPFKGHFVYDNDGRKIYPWEVTSGTNKLGQYGWLSFKDWSVGLK